MDTKASDNRNAILGEAIEALSRLPTATLLPLLPMLGDLGRDRPRPLTAGMARRALDRWRLLRLFRAIKTDLDLGPLSNHQALQHLAKVASRLAPGVRCSVRSMEKRIREYNAIDADGLAAGFAGLLPRYGPPSGTPTPR